MSKMTFTSYLLPVAAIFFVCRASNAMNPAPGVAVDGGAGGRAVSAPADLLSAYGLESGEAVTRVDGISVAGAAEAVGRIRGGHGGRWLHVRGGRGVRVLFVASDAAEGPGDMLTAPSASYSVVPRGAAAPGAGGWRGDAAASLVEAYERADAAMAAELEGYDAEIIKGAAADKARYGALVAVAAGIERERWLLVEALVAELSVVCPERCADVMREIYSRRGRRER